MRPRIIGRALGIGVRVVGRTTWLHLAPLAQSAAAAHAHQAASSAAHSTDDQRRAAGQAAARATIQAGQSLGQAGQSLSRGDVTRGIGGFLRPFRRVGSVLWLEITGAFFLLPVAAFAPTLWRAAVDYRHSSDHRTLWVTAVVVAVFLYLGVTSFWRAHRRSIKP